MSDNLLDDLKSLLIDSVEGKQGTFADDEALNPEEEQIVKFVSNPQEKSYRIYDEDELDLLDIDCRSLLLHIEQMKLLTPSQREQIINKLVHNNTGHISLEEVRWTVLNILDEDMTEDQLLFLDYVLSEEYGLKH